MQESGSDARFHVPASRRACGAGLPDPGPGRRIGRAGPILVATIACVLATTAGPAVAQVPWESPQLLAPGTPEGLGLFVVDWGLGPGNGVGLLLTWRGAAAPGSVGWRGGAARGIDDDVIVAGGLDFSLPVLHASETFPLDVIWTAAAGASYGEYVQVGLPVGFAAGRTIATETLWFNPYVSARAAFEALFGEEKPPNDFRLGLAVDVGADIAFDRGHDVMLRLGASLGDRHALIAGLHARL